MKHLFEEIFKQNQALDNMYIISNTLVITPQVKVTIYCSMSEYTSITGAIYNT